MTVQKEMGKRFDLQTRRTVWIWTILEIEIELVLNEMTETKSQPSM